VNASGLTDGTRYYIMVENESGGYEEIESEVADSDGEISTQVNLPFRRVLGAYTLSLNNSTAQLDTATIYINNTFWVKYLAGSTEADHYIFDLIYTGSKKVKFEIYNWTGNKYELYEEDIDITVFLPDANKAPLDPANIDGAYTDYLNTSTDSGYWTIPWYVFNFTGGEDNLETEYHVNITDSTNSLYSNATLHIKVNMTADTPSDATWGDTITVEGFVFDGEGDGISGYDVALWAPSGSGYAMVDSGTTFPNGEYTLSRSSDVGGLAAGTWYVGTYMTSSNTYRIDETDILAIDDFIQYAHFMVETQDTARVNLESPDEIVDGFVQTLNVSVYNNSDWENDSGYGFYYDQMWVHVTGLDCWYMGTEYTDDDIVALGNFASNGTGYSSNEKYAYYEFDITFNETGTGTIIVTYDQNNSFYEDYKDLEANITGTETFSVGPPDDMTIIVNDMVDEVSVTSVSACCKRNATTTITIEVFGDSEGEKWNASLEITGCGLDIEIDEEDAVDDGYYVSQGVYQVPISPKTAGTITITATNDTENKSVSKDFSVSGLFGTVTTADGDDKEISVKTTEKITMTITNGQYANVYLCYYDSDWSNPQCLNDTTGDGTEGNGLNGVFEFIPEVEDLDHVGYIVCAANAGDYWMYDVVEVAPIHDLYVEIIDPTNTSLQTLTVGLEHEWEFKIREDNKNGSVVGDIDSVTAEILDEDGDTLQTYELEAKSGDIWYMDDWIPHFAGEVLITAVNNTDEDEHDGNISFMAELAMITFSPEAVTAGVGVENITVTVTAMDANGQPIDEGTRFYVNVEDENDTQDIDNDFTLDEDGVGEFDITKAGDNKTKVNLTLQDYYSSDYRGNTTDGSFMIDFPVFMVDPDTIFIGESNLVTITATDYEGNPVEGINLTLLPSIAGILASQPDPVQTDADGMVELSVSPTASGKLNVTIARNLRYVNGQLTWSNAVVTDTYITVTSIKQLKIALSQSPVYEGQTFTVTVTTVTGVSVDGADVEFAGTTVQTGSDGKASFTAPDPGVESVVYTISVEKTGYVSVDKSITVIKVYDITIVGPDSAPSAGEKFTVTVLAKGQPLAGATVTFNGKTYTSGGDGKLTVTAPSEAGDYTITATFPNYADASLTITISVGGVPGFEVLAFVVALGVAFIVLRRRR
jgi:protocatechuate 3,4-dioxygenase beta subunit